jgi:hypothetical protein
MEVVETTNACKSLWEGWCSACDMQNSVMES